MRLHHPQQLLVHAPIASYYQYPRAIPVSAAPELQLYILLHFRRRGERGDGITNLTVDRHALLHENAGGAQPRGQRDRYLGHSRTSPHKFAPRKSFALVPSREAVEHERCGVRARCHRTDIEHVRTLHETVVATRRALRNPIRPFPVHVADIALASSVGRANSSDDEDGEELEHDEDAADAAEEARVSAENLSKVPPFVPASGWIIIMPPDSQQALDSYSWTGKRLAMKFEGGWSTGSFRRKAKRGEREAGQSWFFYKDKGSALLAHKLILAECGPSRTWVIIQEVTKVLKENEATSLLHSVQGSNYARHYKRRMGDVRGSRAGDKQPGGGVTVRG